jgi:hypothetical protein
VPESLPIRRTELEDWLEESQITQPVYHRTRRGNVRSIREEGLRLAYAEDDQVCRGICCSDRPYELLTQDVATLEVAVRITKPLEVSGTTNDIPERVGLPRFGNRAAAVRRALIDAGYDSVIITPRESNPNRTIIVLDDNAVRLIAD